MSDRDDDIPPSEEELAASKRLRDALEDPSVDDPGADLARSLRAAFSPVDLDPEEHARLVEDVASPEEHAAAARLREGLEDDPVVAALRSAWRPEPLSTAAHGAIVERALASVPSPAARGGRVIQIAFGAAIGTLAIAASIVVWMNPPGSGSEIPLARARSTAPLFGEPFKGGDASARIDRIAMARAGDFRDNRFAKWGVR